MTANKQRRHFLIANFFERPHSRRLAVVVILSGDARGVAVPSRSEGASAQSKNLSSAAITVTRSKQKRSFASLRMTT